METKDRVDAYLKEVLWADVKLRPYKGVMDSEDLISRYTLWRVQGLFVEFVLMVRQPGQPNPSACVLAHDIDSLRGRIPMWVAYGSDVMSPTERSRLIRRRVPFIAAGRQIYLPFFGLALREWRCPHPAKWLGVAAQHLLLAALRGEIAGPISDLMGEHIANCSRATVYRAFSELEVFGLVRRTFHGPVFVEGLPLILAELQPRLKRSVVCEALERDLDRLLLCTSAYWSTTTTMRTADRSLRSESRQKSRIVAIYERRYVSACVSSAIRESLFAQETHRRNFAHS